ncbi:MAG TPA: hypothetical protein VHR66_05555 [Gemmataceae bacterium]|jgi:hypothetical protein|nr:hypothetical protein [Gemmataceae bacterium]
MKRCFVLLAVVALATAGCSGGMGRVKGAIVDNGQPVTFPPLTGSVQLSPIQPDGTPDMNKVYAAVVNEDGTFELVASGGELAVGMYQVSIELNGNKGPEKAKAFAAKVKPIKREIKSGQNTLTIDLSKPD